MFAHVRDFTYSKMVLRLTTIDMSGHSWMTLPERWIGRRSAIDYQPRSPDLTPLDFYLWGTLEDKIYRQKPATLTAVVHSGVLRHRRCLAADGGHFEHI
jgi:hypothetical protein